MASEFIIDKVPVSNTANGALSLLFRKFLKTGNLVRGVPYLVERYLAKKRKEKSLSTAENVKTVSSATLYKNILAPEMTWKTFLDLIINFYGADRIEVSIKVYNPSYTVKPIITTILIDGNGIEDDELLNDGEFELKKSALLDALKENRVKEEKTDG